MAGLTVEDLLQIADRVVGPGVRVRDLGLLVGALARACAGADGADVYPTLAEKAAALLHSLVTTFPLVEGNRPFALAAALAMMALGDQPAGISDEEALALVTGIVTGRIEDVQQIAAALRGG